MTKLRKHPEPNPPTGKGLGRTVLNEKGRDLCHDSGIFNFICSNFAALSREFEGLEWEYQIADKASSIAAKYNYDSADTLDPEAVNLIKEWLYQRSEINSFYNLFKLCLTEAIVAGGRVEE